MRPIKRRVIDAGCDVQLTNEPPPPSPPPPPSDELCWYHLGVVKTTGLNISHYDGRCVKTTVIYVHVNAVRSAWIHAAAWRTEENTLQLCVVL